MEEMYRECLRNHAANLGSYATDGCGEFTPDTGDSALQCAACGCHRNFHRKVMMVASTAAAVGDAMAVPSRRSSASASDSVKKRFRTKFSAEQKEKMLRFAEKIGWRLKREDGTEEDRDEEIEQFCKETGVSRQVFKVWMHNHRKSPSSSSSLTH